MSCFSGIYLNPTNHKTLKKFSEKTHHSQQTEEKIIWNQQPAMRFSSPLFLNTDGKALCMLCALVKTSTLGLCNFIGQGTHHFVFWWGRCLSCLSKIFHICLTDFRSVFFQSHGIIFIVIKLVSDPFALMKDHSNQDRNVSSSVSLTDKCGT